MPSRTTIAVFGVLPSSLMAYGWGIAGYLDLGIFLGSREVEYLGKLIICLGGLSWALALCFLALRRPPALRNRRDARAFGTALAIGVVIGGVTLTAASTFWQWVLIVPPIIISILLLPATFGKMGEAV